MILWVEFRWITTTPWVEGRKKRKGAREKYTQSFSSKKKEPTRLEFESHQFRQNTNSSQRTKKLCWFCQNLFRIERMYESVWRVPYSLSQKNTTRVRYGGCVSLNLSLWRKGEIGSSLGGFRGAIFLGDGYVSSMVGVLPLGV